ncbi:MAG: bifunctional phosphoglucose/phosphomannose isomerase [Armatimonadetes bacterium]|nr:bifunctional phosphoglucose/phosphomannose isomerase [Armatimonadota bacterium]
MVLDDVGEITRIDAGGMLGLIQRLADMTLEGWLAAADIPLPPRRPGVVVVAGLGGSGIGGDLLRALLAPYSPIPIVVVKDTRLPAFVGPETLLFASSYSGNTEETLALHGAARRSGAWIVAITSGGTLARRARAEGHPVVTVPAGLPPRAALPHLLMPMLRVTASLGLGGPTDSDVRATAALLRDLAGRLGPAVPVPENPAKRLASRLHGHVPVVYAATPTTAPVAYRWKTQLNENAKVFALWNAFPELSHNEVVGWEGVQAAGAPFVVILRDEDDGPRAAREVEAAKAVSLSRARGVEEVWSQGMGLLTRLMSLVLFGDFVSAYLAVLRGIDPTPIQRITEMKRRLQDGPEAR